MRGGCLARKHIIRCRNRYRLGSTELTHSARRFIRFQCVSGRSKLMCQTIRVVLLLSLFTSVSQLTAHEHLAREAFVSDASHLIGTYVPKSRDHSAAAMAEGAQAFLSSLTAEQRQAVSRELTHPERRKWTNLPQWESDALPLGNCNAEQVKAFCNMLANLLSEQGYQKVCNIMLADDQLLEGGQPRRGIGTETFDITIFGTPSPTKPWGLQIDGHHLGLNLSIEGNLVTNAPSFIGTQPEVFKIEEDKYRPMAGENDIAFQLVNSLGDEQQQKAILSEERGGLIAGPGEENIPTLPGVECSTFDEAQEEMVLKLISRWVNDLPPRLAEKRMQQIKSELDEMRFGWKGPLEDGSDVTYTIQGPSLIIEYTAQDDEASHIHSIYRDPTNAYGGQLDFSEKLGRLSGEETARGAFDAFQNALMKGDWNTAFLLVTPESRDFVLAGFLMACHSGALGTEGRTLVEEFVDVEKLNDTINEIQKLPEKEQLRSLPRLSSLVEKKALFAESVLILFEKQELENWMVDLKQSSRVSLTNPRIIDDRATATLRIALEQGSGAEPMKFIKADGRWFLDLTDN